MSTEVIDVQTLNPFDVKQHDRRESLEKTHAVLFLDEDVPGGGVGVHDAAGPRGAERLVAPGLRRRARWPRRRTGRRMGRMATTSRSRTAEASCRAVYEIMRERRPEQFPELGF